MSTCSGVYALPGTDMKSDEKILKNGLYEHTPIGIFKILSYYVDDILIAVIHCTIVRPPQGEVGNIINIFNMKIINPKYRKNGYMSKIITQLKNDKNVKMIVTSYTDSSYAGKKLLEKLGFYRNNQLLIWENK